MIVSTINSFDEYIKYTEKYKNQFLFRGQANSDWNIVPSIFRNKKLLNEEVKNITENYLYDRTNILVSLFKMQHYGNPTRLIDLTISPYSALFFSIDDDTQKDKDGIVYVIDKSKAISFSDVEIDAFCKMLVDDELESKNYTEEIKRKVIEDQIIQYDYKFSYTNKRAILQGGTALLIGFGLKDDKITRDKNICLDNLISEKIIIPAKLKTVLYSRLSALGYSRSILYESFESSYKNLQFDISIHKFEVTPNTDFTKIVATYKLSTIEINRDDRSFAKCVSYWQL